MAENLQVREFQKRVFVAFALNAAWSNMIVLASLWGKIVTAEATLIIVPLIAIGLSLRFSSYMQSLPGATVLVRCLGILSGILYPAYLILTR